MYDNDHRVHTPPAMMARAVFTATLTRPQPHPEGVAALRRVGIPDPEQVLDDHRLCYPPTDPATVCEPLYPDRLGEDFLALSTPGHLHTTHQPDPWADTAIAQLLAPTENSDGQQRPQDYSPQAVTVLIETARRWPHIAQGQLFPLLREHPVLALATGGTALTRLADLPDVDLSILESIEALLPTGRHVDLDLAIAAVTSRLTQHRLATTTDSAARARLHAILGYRLAHASRHDEALTATTDAVTLYRRLAQTNPAAYEPDLARGLWGFAWVCAAGQIELPQALHTVEESVGIYERLTERLPQVFTDDWRGALGTLAEVLDQLGRDEDAGKVRHRIDQLGEQG